MGAYMPPDTANLQLLAGQHTCRQCGILSVNYVQKKQSSVLHLTRVILSLATCAIGCPQFGVTMRCPGSSFRKEIKRQVSSFRVRVALS